MIKHLFKDTLIYGAGRILTYGVSLLLVPLYTHIFAPADYGIIDILTLLISLVNLTIALEISQALFRFLPDLSSHEEQVSYSSTALWFTMTVYGLFVVATWMLADKVSQRVLNSDHQQTTVQIAALATWSGGVFLLVQNKLRAQLQPTAYTISNVLYTLSYLALAVLFVGLLSLGIKGVFLGQLIASLLACGLALYFSRSDFRPVFNWRHLKEMLRFSVPLVPSSVAVFIYLYIDRLLINELMSLSDMGVFSIGYRIATVVNLLMFGFQGALTPLIYNYYAQPGAPSDLARIFRYFAAAALVLSLALSLFARELLTIFTTPAYYDAAWVIPLLTPAVIFSNMYIFAPGLTIAKKTGRFAVINVAGAALNTALNLALIPLLGIQGAALATLISAATIFAVHMLTSQRFYFVPHSWGRLGVATVLVTVIGLVGLNLLPGLAFKVLLLALAAVALIRLQLVSVSEIQRMLDFTRQFANRRHGLISIL
jgi:O-antigen/teichoic acid export membrane protein